MLNNKGTTLIEALFAFSIYVTIIVLFISLMSSLNSSGTMIYKRQKKAMNEEKLMLMEGGDDSSIIEKVLP